MTTLIIHGLGGHAGIHWQQWLHDQLIASNHSETKKKYQVIMPNLPDSEHPDRQIWLETIKRTLDTENSKPSSDLVIVAHSLGVTTALDYIETISTPIKALISVSGFADDYEAELNSYFMAEKQINFNKVNQNLQQSFVFYGDNDPYVPQTSLKLLADNLKVKPIIIKNGGHLNTDTGYTQFPQLLEIIKEL